MSTAPTVLSIAGFDPSGGAGILADIKTFEKHGVYGLGVCSALTVQNEDDFKKVEWVAVNLILEQIDILLENHHVAYVKVGLIEGLEVLERIADHLNERIPGIRIIWDPILAASAGFVIHGNVQRSYFEKVCKKMYLVTPNLFEMRRLMPDWGEVEAAKYLSSRTAILLKGGHDHGVKVKDLLFEQREMKAFTGERLREMDKHGTGCVLSSAITARLASGDTLAQACEAAKGYVERFMRSHPSLLGWHFGGSGQ